MEKVRFRITAADIVNGEKGKPFTCAVALAMQRRIPTVSIVIGGNGGYFNGVWYKLPKKVLEFINMFDSDRTKVRPMQFTMELPLCKK